MNMNIDFSNPLVSIALTVLVLGLLIYRQLRPRRLSSRGLVIIPAIVLYFILNNISAFHPSTTKLVEVGISVVVSITFGLLACRELKVYASEKTGKAMASGSWVYFLWWLAAFIVKTGLSFAFGETMTNANQVEILIPVFFLVATRSAYLFWRVEQLGLELHSRREY